MCGVAADNLENFIRNELEELSIQSNRWPSLESHWRIRSIQMEENRKPDFQLSFFLFIIIKQLQKIL